LDLGRAPRLRPKLGHSHSLQEIKCNTIGRYRRLDIEFDSSTRHHDSEVR
jgi:hypothetical protein